MVNTLGATPPINPQNIADIVSRLPTNPAPSTDIPVMKDSAGDMKLGNKPKK